jgi:hypothetical protein
MILDIEELWTFVAVADAGGVSAAALRLGVAKSIVSRRLARLEAGMGVQLLSRTTRGAALTEAGTTCRDLPPGSAPRSTWQKKRLHLPAIFAAACALPPRLLSARLTSLQCLRKWDDAIRSCISTLAPQ